MSWGTIDTKQFDAFAEHINAEVSSNKLKTAVRESVRRVGTQTLRGVKNRTPAKTGTLRRGWDLQGPFIGPAVISLTVSNNVEYAPFVESGHRTRGGGGWVPGSHMLMKTLFEIDDQMPALLTPALQSYLQGLM